MFFSIIVPIYNVDKYLPESIESVIKQKTSDYELILVDDGSTDACPKICDEYTRTYSNITVIHKKNGGLSDSRNVGLRAATGKYVVFLDSDDLMNENSLVNSRNILENNGFPEIMIGNMLNMEGEHIYCRLPYDINRVNADNIYALMENFIREYGYIPWAAYQNIYKRDFLNKNNYIFDKDIIGAEDCDFFMSISQAVNSFCLSDINLVIYRMQREGSIITSPKFSAVYGQLVVFAKWYDFCKEKEYQTYTYFFADRFTNIIILIGFLSKENAKKCATFVIKHDYILKDCSSSLKYRFAKIIWKLFGYCFGSFVLLKMRRK